MTHEEVKILLNDYFDEKLSIEVNTEIQVHLSECSDCSQYLFSLQDLMKKADQLPRNIKPPTNFWHDIFTFISSIKAETIKQQEEIDLKEAAKVSEESSEEKKTRDKRLKAEKLLAWERKKAALLQNLKKPWFKYSLIGLASLVLLFFIYDNFLSKGNTWEVKKLRVGSSSYSEAFSNLEEDQLLETNSVTRLEIQIPKLGSIFLEHDSKIERLKADKIRLLKGSILAVKKDANELLSIEVPGADIKDYFLGGQLKVTVTNPEASLLEVIDGWVSINKDNVETLVLSNHFCQIRADSGVGLPYHKFSAKEFVEAINNYCFTSPGNEEALISILTKADVSNSVTLWNLMQRVTRKQRDMVIYTMFGLLGNPPQGVTDEGLRTLDPGMMQKLIEEIELRI
ncbi:MAG TPA: zf-HC2 domain-containing protein [Ignavibacteriaceae bacterium]